MIIYRILHHIEVHALRERVLDSCLYHNNLPYFSAFDSVAAALIESHIFREYHRIPSSMRMVEYTIANGAAYKEYISEPLITYTGGSVLPSLTETAQLCLAGEVAVIASFPSLHYKNLQNFLINPRHPHFSKVTMSRIYPCV